MMDKNKDAYARFNKIVLSWDYFDLHKQSLKRDKGASLGLDKVKLKYKDTEDYISTFESLLFEEVKAQIVQGRNIADVTGMILGAVITCNEASGFYLPVVAYMQDESESISENDLLLLCKDKYQPEESILPSTYAFALVLNREGGNHFKLCTFLAGEVQKTNTDDVKHSARLQRLHSVFTAPDGDKRGVYILKIASLSTIIREYVGLRSITSLPFKDLILSAADGDSSSEDGAWKIPKPLMESLENNHNASQLDAIRAGLSRRAFVLIQGPPGTGKTQTILGLLSAILHATPSRVQSKEGSRDLRRGPELHIINKYNHWKQASPWLYDINPRDKIVPIDGDDGYFPTTGNEFKPEVVNSNRKYRVRVLVCAPSNSALDEIVLRVMRTGIRDENDHIYNPKIVRIGLKPHHSVQAVSMDYLVQQKLSGIDQSIADAKKHGATGGDRDSIRASVLSEAAIVFSTLSFSGSNLFSKLNHVFDVVIIDEAAQAVEPATLVPLANGCKQVFLVGDPDQLPATVISTIAEKHGYGMSLFKRFQKAEYPVQILKTQYRMHPEIRYFPSKEFYKNELEDGPDVKDETQRSWHDYRCFGPFCFFDIEEGVESQPSGSGSFVNKDEVEFVLLMYKNLVTRYPELKPSQNNNDPDYSSSSQIAIISPYGDQTKLFRDGFRDQFGVESNKLVDINTVDGFQGREKDVAIFSCVRANKNKSIGFVADSRRMNVGITRARSSILVVGSASTLKQDEHWCNLVKNAEERQCIFKIRKPYAAFFSDENMPTMKVAKKVEAMIEEVQSHLDVTESNTINYGNQDVGVDDGGDGGMDDD